jgi:uncharacterized protein
MVTDHFIWGNRRHYHAYSDHYIKLFGERLQKLSIDAGFTCPNRDGTIGINGCIFCDNNAFNPSYCSPEKSITTQIEEGIEFHAKRYRHAGKFLAYFQAFSNTYLPLEKLKIKYEEALQCPGVVGLVIGTRPDCVDEKKLDYLAELAKDFHIVIEFGVESCYNKTLKKINRGHTFEQSLEAIEMTATRGIQTGIHLVFGLSGESREDQLKEAEIISALPIQSVKFHQLQIIKDTEIAKQYEKTPEKFSLFTLPEYIEFIIDFTERLNPEIIIERFTGEVPPRFLAVQHWELLRNDQIIHRIEKRMEERDTWQGRLFANTKS